jgi:hypothetical protein
VNGDLAIEPVRGRHRRLAVEVEFEDVVGL